jgi:hypothetical protein
MFVWLLHMCSRATGVAAPGIADSSITDPQSANRSTALSSVCDLQVLVHDSYGMTSACHLLAERQSERIDMSAFLLYLVGMQSGCK